MPYINSSAINRIEWEDGVLSIWFKTGRYDYPGVPLNVYKDFLASDSQGKFYNLYIRDRY
ncbi:MAG: KTSC domain-containing protein [Cohaesibacter sp.]|nr:KTSC domain-containing protein [Cohaesibacter sp.]